VAEAICCGIIIVITRIQTWGGAAMRAARWIGVMVAGLLLVVGTVRGQTPVALTIYVDADSLTVFVPGNQVVSLQALTFEVTYSQGDVRSYPLADYFSFPLGELPTPICLHLEYEDGSGLLNSNCAPAQTPRIELQAPDVFWYDLDGRNHRVMRVLRGFTPIALCVGGTQTGCQLTYIPPTWTPLPPTWTPSPTSASSATPLIVTMLAPTLDPNDIRAQAIASVTAAVAQTQTAMPTATPTPTLTLTPMPDIPATQAAISTEIVQTALAVETLIAQEAYIAGLPFTGRNADWTPIIREFDGVPMALVPVGCFMMGSETGQSDEAPQHEVCIEQPFWIDVTEVTQGQFVAFGGQKANANGFTGDERPVEQITWFEAYDYCVNQRDMRLPTEAEWEFAARGVESWVYPWGNTFDGARVVYNRSSSEGTADAGSRPSGVSWVGAMDMSGNVWEWVNTIYNQDRFPYPYREDDGREDVQDISNLRVLRGGSWNNANSDFLRAPYRDWLTPDVRFSNGGVRCARS
jgi:formylglycine-generating enzyme required for sulfatase activity